MCNPGDPSGLTYENTYWYPHQWADAVKEAIREGRRQGQKFQVWRGTHGWKIGPVLLPLGHEYNGNLCGGLGGKTECNRIDLKTGRKCRKSPSEHRPIPRVLALYLRDAGGEQ